MVEIQKYEYRGKKYSLAELSKLSGINAKSLFDRIQRWEDVEKAINTPIRKRTALRKKKNKEKCICDEWGCDCFNCQLPDCIDNRVARRGEIPKIQIAVSSEIEYNDKTYKVLGFTVR